MPNKWNKPDRVQSNVKRSKSSSGKQYYPTDLSKQTKIHVLGDLDLKALITPTCPVPKSIMRTVVIGWDGPADRALARPEKNSVAGQRLQAGAAERQSHGKFWYAAWLTTGPSLEERRQRSQGMAARLKATLNFGGAF
jgi:hypothetical protein